jgi:uncharacterized protein YecE (DUF72 family)
MAKNLFIESQDNTGIWRIGTSGWSYPPSSGPGSWTGVFYPFSKTDELKFYSRYFNAVEINSTFYRPCAPKTAESWAKRTPEQFEFTVKAWQQFTHKKDLWLPEDIRDFKAGIAPLAEANKLGCVLFQFPASFRCSPETIERLKTLMSEFAEFDKAVELRHRSWVDNMQLLEELGAIPAFIDEPKFRDSIRQELGSVLPCVYGFHGRKAEKWWHHEHRNEQYTICTRGKSARMPAASGVAQERAIQKARLLQQSPQREGGRRAVMLRAELIYQSSQTCRIRSRDFSIAANKLMQGKYQGEQISLLTGGKTRAIVLIASGGVVGN